MLTYSKYLSMFLSLSSLVIKKPNSCYIVAVQLVNHGISSSLLEKLNHEVEGFFKLPLEEKMKFKIRPGDVQGYGTVVRSDSQRLDWGDRVYMIINPIHRRKPHLLPELPSSLRFSLSLIYVLFFFILSFPPYIFTCIKLRDLLNYLNKSHFVTKSLRR